MLLFLFSPQIKDLVLILKRKIVVSLSYNILIFLVWGTIPLIMWNELSHTRYIPSHITSSKGDPSCILFIISYYYNKFCYKCIVTVIKFSWCNFLMQNFNFFMFKTVCIFIKFTSIELDETWICHDQYFGVNTYFFYFYQINYKHFW